MKGGFFIQQDVNEYIVTLMPEVFLKHPDLFQKKDQYQDYLEQKEYIQEQNKIILEELSSKLVERFGDQYVASELFLMQKLFLLYPKKSPTDLLSLSWEHVKFLLNIFDKKERAFYIQECLQRNWDLEKLKEMYFQDTYKKYNYVAKQYRHKSFSMDLFYKVLPLIWQEE